MRGFNKLLPNIVWHKRQGPTWRYRRKWIIIQINWSNIQLQSMTGGINTALFVTQSLIDKNQSVSIFVYAGMSASPWSKFHSADLSQQQGHNWQNTWSYPTQIRPVILSRHHINIDNICIKLKMWSWMAHTKTSPSLSILLLFRLDSKGMHVNMVYVCCIFSTKHKQMKTCQVWKQNLVGVSIMVVAPATHVCRIRWKSSD